MHTFIDLRSCAHSSPDNIRSLWKVCGWVTQSFDANSYQIQTDRRSERLLLLFILVMNLTLLQMHTVHGLTSLKKVCLSSDVWILFLSLKHCWGLIIPVNRILTSHMHPFEWKSWLTTSCLFFTLSIKTSIIIPILDSHIWLYELLCQMIPIITMAPIITTADRNTSL